MNSVDTSRATIVPSVVPQSLKSPSLYEPQLTQEDVRSSSFHCIPSISLGVIGIPVSAFWIKQDIPEI